MRFYTLNLVFHYLSFLLFINLFNKHDDVIFYMFSYLISLNSKRIQFQSQWFRVFKPSDFKGDFLCEKQLQPS